MPIEFRDRDDIDAMLKQPRAERPAKVMEIKIGQARTLAGVLKIRPRRPLRLERKR